MSTGLIVVIIASSATILAVAGAFIWSVAEKRGRRKEYERIRSNKHGGSAMPR